MAPGLWRGPRAPLPLSAPAGPTPLAAGLQAPGQPWPFVARWRRPAALFAKRLAAWEAKGGPTIGAGPGQLDPRAVEHMSNLSEPLAMRAVKDLISLNGAGVDVGAVAGAGAAAKDAFGSDELGHRTLDLRSSSFSTAQTLKSYAGRFSQFAEFCHDSENISPLEATTATFVRWEAGVADKQWSRPHHRSAQEDASAGRESGCRTPTSSPGELALSSWAHGSTARGDPRGANGGCWWPAATAACPGAAATIEGWPRRSAARARRRQGGSRRAGAQQQQLAGAAVAAAPQRAWQS
eukprot:jgi/Tetstr1/421315/TSEL_012286.t1